MNHENQLICSNCDAEIGDTDKFCKNCGQPQDETNLCPGCEEETVPGMRFCANCGHALDVSTEDEGEFDSVVGNLGTRGENLLSDNLGSNEAVYVKLKGTFGEGFVVTDKRLYVLKWGIMAGNTFGGRCLAFEFRNITSVEFKKKLGTGTVEILTPATQNAQKSYWGSGANSAIKSDNVVTFQSPQFKDFQTGVNIAREIVSAKG